MTRGTWRPKNLNLARSNTSEDVQEKSKIAFELISKENNLRKAFSTLQQLKGVGAATASAVLACYIPEKVAFMSDEALEAASFPLKYTLANWQNFNQALKAKCEDIQTISTKFTLNDLQQCLWSHINHLNGKLTLYTKPETSTPTVINTVEKEKESSDVIDLVDDVQIAQKRPLPDSNAEPPSKQHKAT